MQWSASVKINIEAWLSLVERCVRDAEVVGSNPVASIRGKPVFMTFVIETGFFDVWKSFLSFVVLERLDAGSFFDYCKK